MLHSGTICQASLAVLSAPSQMDTVKNYQRTGMINDATVGLGIMALIFPNRCFEGFVQKISYDEMASDDDNRNHGKAYDDNGNNRFSQRSLNALSGKLQF